VSPCQQAFQQSLQLATQSMSGRVTCLRSLTDVVGVLPGRYILSGMCPVKDCENGDISPLPVGLMHPGLVQSLVGFVPNRENVVPKQVDVVPMQVDVVPMQVDVVPMQVDVVPKRVDVVPMQVDVVPKRVNVVPARVERVPGRFELVPGRQFKKMEIEMIAYGISCNFPKENIEIGSELLQKYLSTSHSLYFNKKR